MLHTISTEYARRSEFKISYGIYCLCELFLSDGCSLPQFTYVLETFLQDSSVASLFLATKDSDDILTSLAHCQDQLLRLGTLYKEDTYHNPYIIERSMQFINQSPTEITLSALGKKMGLNPTYLSSVISKSTGVTFRGIIFCRRLISFFSIVNQNSKENLEDIAYQIGYKSVHQFSKSFKQHIGMTPSILKRNLLLIKSLNIEESAS